MSAPKEQGIIEVLTAKIRRLQFEQALWGELKDLEFELERVRDATFVLLPEIRELLSRFIKGKQGKQGKP